jgi:cyclase
MFIPRIIPVLLLKNKGLYKTVKFDKRGAKYIGDPINAVRIFNDLEADELIILDITASMEHRLIDINTVKNIGDEAFMPFAVGGGINTIEEIKAILSAGAEKVVLGSAAIRNPELITQASSQFGNQSIVVSVDYKKNLWGQYKVYINDGTESNAANPLEFALEMEQKGAGEILLHSIGNDGIMTGYDVNLIADISKALSIPLIACGGAGQHADLSAAIDAGASACAAGSMFVYHGPRKAVLINYPEKKLISTLFGDK